MARVHAKTMSVVRSHDNMTTGKSAQDLGAVAGGLYFARGLQQQYLYWFWHEGVHPHAQGTNKDETVKPAHTQHNST